MIPNLVSTRDTATNHTLGRDPVPSFLFLFRFRFFSTVFSTSMVRSSRQGLRLANSASHTVRGIAAPYCSGCSTASGRDSFVSFLEDPLPLAEAGTTTQSVWMIRTSLVVRKKCRSRLRLLDVLSATLPLPDLGRLARHPPGKMAHICLTGSRQFVRLHRGDEILQRARQDQPVFDYVGVLHSRTNNGVRKNQINSP